MPTEIDLSGTGPSDRDIVEANQAVRRAFITAITKLPPELAVQLPNISRCLDELTRLRAAMQVAATGPTRAILETPYAGDVEGNTQFARACMLDCLRRNEAPFASHLLYTQVLDDLQPDERSLGIHAGFAWRPAAQRTVVYTDRGISGGMAAGIEQATQLGVPVDYRTLKG